MVCRTHVRRMVLLAIAMALAAAVPTASAARRPRSALDEVERSHPAPEVEIVVLRFVHIPAESFADTLEQLAEHPQIRAGMEQMPLAVNEAANAVVLVAPPKVADALRRLADELDQPNEFLMHEREREHRRMQWRMEREQREREFDRDQAEFDLEMEERRRALDRGRARFELQRRSRRDLRRDMGRPPRGPVCDPDCRCPHRGTPRCRDAGRPRPPGCRCPRCPLPGKKPPRPGKPCPMAGRPCPKMEPPRGPKAGREKPPHAKPPRPRSRRPEKERPRPEGEPRRLGPGPMGPGLGRLLTPDGREALGLSDEQVEQIENLVRRLRRHVEETFEGIRERLRRAGPEDRQHLLGEIREKMAGRWGEQRRNVMDRLAEILNPDQRERMKEWMQGRGPGPWPGRRGPPEGPMERPRGRRGPHRPSALERPAGCRMM